MWVGITSATEPSAVLQLNPENPHYFLWRGKPTILITSGEHYGSVLNLDFDYAKYLGTLSKYGFNLTRTFCGAGYIEPVGSFKIAENTLAPKPGRYLTPWARSAQPGAWDGGNKWDLTKWNEDYFKRFKDFVSQAATHGVVVEVNLFCPFYENGKNTVIKVRKETPTGVVEEDRKIKESSMWPLSPFNPANNINGFNPVSGHDVYTLDQNGGLLTVQETFVRRIVEELKDFDNVYYEICNEPYFAGVTEEWQRHIAGVIHDAQKDHPAKKLISQNTSPITARKIIDPLSTVSIFNFHYTYPLHRRGSRTTRSTKSASVENETGFRGTADEVYRNEAWDFLLAGGGLFNNLDYSFTAGHEDGTFAYPLTQPGGGGPSFHRQLAVLVKFMNDLDFIHLKPADELPCTASHRTLRSTCSQIPARNTPLISITAPRPSGRTAKTAQHRNFQACLQTRSACRHLRDHLARSGNRQSALQTIPSPRGRRFQDYCAGIRPRPGHAHENRCPMKQTLISRV